MYTYILPVLHVSYTCVQVHIRKFDVCMHICAYMGSCVSACVTCWASHEELRALTYAHTTLLHIVPLWHNAIATPAAQ